MTYHRRRTISRAEWRAKFSFKTVQHNIFIEKHMKFVQHQMYNLSSNKSLKIPKGGNQNPCYIRHHDLVDRYGISVSQMTTDIFNMS
jgi:hypothetical protein